MSELAYDLMERVPLSIVASILILGILLLFVSPILFLVPTSWLAGLLFGDVSTALSSLILFSVAAIIIGLPMFYVKGLILGSGGANHQIVTWCKKHFRKKKATSEEKEDPNIFDIQKNELKPFIEWMRDTGQIQTLELNHIENGLVSSLILVGEVSLPLNLIFLGSFYLGAYPILANVGAEIDKTVFLGLLGFPKDSSVLISIVVWSFVIFLAAFVYDKKILKTRMRNVYSEVAKNFRAYQDEFLEEF